MHFMKHLLLFIKNHLMQLRRKWLSLPLLLVFPIIIVGLTAAIIITIFLPEENETIRVGLVDLDQSKETQLVVQLFEESSQLSSYISLHSMSENEAKISIDNNEISSYLVFPQHFAENLYNGEAVLLPVIGNPNQSSASYMINELIESVTRHIRAAQANILTINDYAKEFGMEDEARNDFVFQQFQEFLFYTIGRDQVLNDKEITNEATSSPIAYFSLSGWFIVLTIWLLAIYNFFTKENSMQIRNRMRLYGVTELQQLTAKIIVSFLVCILFASIVFILIKHTFQTEIILEDYVRITIVTVLYSSMFLLCLSFLEIIIKSHKIRLLVQSLFALIGIIISGAIIPVIYYPLWVQEILPYTFFYEALNWLQEIVLNDRLYTDYIPLLLMNTVGLFLVLGISLWKERVHS